MKPIKHQGRLTAKGLRCATATARLNVFLTSESVNAAISAVELVNLYKAIDGGDATAEVKEKVFPHVV